MWRSLIRWLTASTALVLACAVAGFFVFAAFATRPLPQVSVQAEAIVVLTGAANRIREASNLLKANRGRRLLISGVNEMTPPRDVRLLTGLDRPLFSCCVDIGYRARDTIGNAAETRAWVDKNGFRSLVVVTSRFHMPRSLAELGRALPHTSLMPFPIAPAAPSVLPWWQDRDRAIVLLSEYVKFVPAAARYAISRLLNGVPGPRAPLDTPDDATKPGTVAGAS